MTSEIKSDDSDIIIEVARWKRAPYYFIGGSLEFRVLRALRSELTYYESGYERSDAYKKGVWDGSTCLFYTSKKGNHYFPVGLKDRVLKVMDDYGVDYYVKDLKLADVSDNYDKVDLKWSGPELRDYQKDAFNAIIENEGGVISLPTASGKTIILLKLLEHYKLPSLILVNTKDLLSQWEYEIEKNLDGKIPYVFNDKHKTIGDITVGMVQSVSKAIGNGTLKKMDFPVFAVDECHHVPADTVFLISNHVNAPVRIGASVDRETSVVIRRGGNVSVVTIGDLHDLWSAGVRSIDVLSCDLHGKSKFTEVRNVWSIPWNNSLTRVTLDNGEYIDLTDDHSIMAYNSEDISLSKKKTSEISIGDYIPIHCAGLSSGKCDRGDKLVDLLKYASRGVTKVKDVEELSVLYDKHIGTPDQRLRWSKSGCIPIEIAKKINITPDNTEYIKTKPGKSGCRLNRVVSEIDLSMFLGLFLADGGCDNHKVIFYTSNNGGEVEKFTDVISKVCNVEDISIYSRTDGDHNGGNGVCICINSTVLSDILDTLGCATRVGKYKVIKNIPSFILNNIDLYEYFIDGYVIGDGYDKIRNGRHRVSITTSRRDFATAIMYMLSSMGLKPHVCKTRSRGGVKHMGDNLYTAYRISYNKTVAIGRSARKRWYKHVPFVGRLKDLHTLSSNRRTRVGEDKRYTTSFGRSKRISEYNVAKILTRCNARDKIWLCNNDIYLSKVVSITKLKRVDRVYDISTKNETFFGNGILCHNSATPTRTDGAELKIWASVGEIKCKITPTELIKAGILAKPKFEFLRPPPVYVSKWEKWHRAYIDGIVANEGRNSLVVKKAIEYSKKGHTVYVHVDRIDHGDILCDRIPGSVFLHGKHSKELREKVLGDFGGGKIKVLVSTLLKEGINIPSMSCFIAAGGGKSEIAVIQKAGRALRVAPGKKEAIIIDFVDSGRFFGDHWSERYNTYKETFGEYCP